MRRRFLRAPARRDRPDQHRRQMIAAQGGNLDLARPDGRHRDVTHHHRSRLGRRARCRYHRDRSYLAGCCRQSQDLSDLHGIGRADAIERGDRAAAAHDTVKQSRRASHHSGPCAGARRQRRRPTVAAPAVGLRPSCLGRSRPPAGRSCIRQAPPAQGSRHSIHAPSALLDRFSSWSTIAGRSGPEQAR